MRGKIDGEADIVVVEGEVEVALKRGIHAKFPKDLLM